MKKFFYASIFSRGFNVVTLRGYGSEKRFFRIQGDVLERVQVVNAVSRRKKNRQLGAFKV
jgi:hypothetical protein